MAAKLIKGNEIAEQIREELKQETANLKAKYNVVPGLVTILVGENPASVSYVTGKQKTSKELGFYSVQDNQPEAITEDQLLKLVDKYNKDPKIHGILVQLPLPKHINETKVLYAIDPKKDVDGFHPVNVGKLMIGEADYLPCTRWNPAASDPLRREDRRGRGSGCGKIEHCGKTDHKYPLTETEGGQCNGDDLPHRNKGHGLPHQEGRYPHRRRWKTESHHRRHD
jgi:hypothetical protein